MAPTVHLAAVVGGGDSKLLPHLITHYRRLGVESFRVVRHAETTAEPAYGEIEDHLRDAGLKPHRTVIGPWSDDMHTRLIADAMSTHPDDWHIVVDLDEFHVYDRPLAEMVALCEREGWDHVNGCFVDRVGAEGTLPPVGPGSIWRDFPLGGTLTTGLVRAPSLKTGLARGHVQLHTGHHGARSAAGAPIDRTYIQVHHFKWTASLVQRLRRRAERYESGEWDIFHPAVPAEARRILAYLDRFGGRIDVRRRRLRVAPAGESYHEYPHWAGAIADAQSWKWILEQG